MSGGESSQSQLQSTNSASSSSTTPTDYAMDYAKQGLYDSAILGSSGYTPYPYYSDASGNTKSIWGDNVDTVANLNDIQTGALTDLYSYATSDNPLIDNATTSLSDTLSGKYLNADSNPYLSSYVDDALDTLTRNYNTSTYPGLKSAASRAGAFGGSTDTLLQSESTNNLGNLLGKYATNMYNNAYNTERSAMTSAYPYVSTISQLPATMSTLALGVGDVYQQQEQSEISDLVNKWQQAMYWPYFSSGAGKDLFSTYGWGSQSEGTSSSTGTSTNSKSSGGSTGGDIMSGLGTAATIAALFI
jgi:hypothetical protein